MHPQGRAKVAKARQDAAENKLYNIPTLSRDPFKPSWISMHIHTHMVVHFVAVWVYWVIISQRVPMAVFWGCQILRLPFMLELIGYFAQKELQTNVNVNVLATFKFVLMIFLSVHYIGLVSYFLCVISRFEAAYEWQSWVVQFEVNNLIEIRLGPYLTAENYLLCLYKGLNSLTNLGYEGTVPRRYGEMILSMAVFLLQTVVEAYILGKRCSRWCVPSPPCFRISLSFPAVPWRSHAAACHRPDVPTSLSSSEVNFPWSRSSPAQAHSCITS